MLYMAVKPGPLETPQSSDLDRLQRNERGMLRRICRVRPDERVGSADVHEAWYR